MLTLISTCRLKDDVLLSEILRYIILRGPVTAYRIARSLNIHFTQAYRKVTRLEHFGMVRRVANRRGDMFEATERGIIICYYFNCANWEILIDKLATRHQLPRFALRAFLDAYLDHFKNDAIIDDVPVMVFYALYKRAPVPAELMPAVTRHLLMPARASS